MNARQWARSVDPRKLLESLRHLNRMKGGGDRMGQIYELAETRFVRSDTHEQIRLHAILGFQGCGEVLVIRLVFRKPFYPS